MTNNNSKLPPALQQHTAYLITDIGRLYRKELDRRLSEYGLSRSQWWLISFLIYFDGATQQELANVMDVGKGGLGKLVERMEKKGFVVRKRSTADRRANHIYLSEKIRKLVKEIENELTETAESSLSNISATERKKLNRMLTEIRQSMIDNDTIDNN